ncbi:MAG: lipocalin-like domain-containing protein, partial [Acidobacteriota bacterium]
MGSKSCRYASFLMTLTVALVAACRQPEAAASNPEENRLTLSGLLAGDDTEGYTRALEPRKFFFPDDHGPHPDFRNEWWYLTGNLSSADGREFGYQFTLFRNAISPRSPERESDWATRQIFMAHFALTDVTGESFHAFERLSRGALGLAGVTTRPFRAWLEDWQIWADQEPPAFRLRAGNDAVGLELDLDSAKPIVLQGDRGLSRKGREPGNASYYYSMTRMPTRGVVMLGLESYAVQGSSWLDREWSSSALEPTQSGWDWFALLLSDGLDLMIYQLRTRTG